MRPNADRQRPGLLWVAAMAALLFSSRMCLTAGSAFASDLRYTAIVRAVEAARPAVVNIQGRKTVRVDQFDAAGGDPFRQVNGMGTGIIIDSRGFILTNYHVVESVELIQVALHDGKTYTGRLLSKDPITDLAIVKIQSDSPLTPIHLGISTDLMPGEPVIAVGNAYGYHHTVTRGIISALHREVQVSANQNYDDLIQTDASINPGNSGGPLLNIDGEMIGINVAVRVGAQGIGFAIPVDEALEIAAQLMSTERIERVRHGIYGETRQTDNGRYFVVTALGKNSSGEQCGLRVGDLVTAVGEKPVHRALEFEQALIGQSPQQPVPLQIQRAGQSLTVDLVLAGNSRPVDSFDTLTWNTFGIKLIGVPETEFRRFQSQYRGGMRVTSVRANSPAAGQGIRSGDILVGMHIWETLSEENVRYVLNHAELADLQPLKFYILRGGETLYGHLKISAQQLVASRRSDLTR